MQKYSSLPASEHSPVQLAPASARLFFARCEASQLGSLTIRSEHLLFGIAEQNADAVERHLKVDAAALKKQLAAEPLNAQCSAWIKIPLDREVKRAIGYAIKEAKFLGHKSIEIEHLLLGIMHDDRCVAAKALRTAGAAALTDVRKSISECH